MKKLAVRDLLAFSPGPPCVVRAEATMREVAGLMLADRGTRDVYLVDSDGRFLGVISLRRLARHLFRHDVPDRSATDMLELMSAQGAGDLALRKAAFVQLDDQLEQVLDVMFRFDVNEVPVVDAQKVVVGRVGMLDLVAAWEAGKLGGEGRPPA